MEQNNERYSVRVVSMNSDGSYDLQRESNFSNYDEAVAAYNSAEYTQPFTDVLLCDTETGLTIMATNDAL